VEAGDPQGRCHASPHVDKDDESRHPFGSVRDGQRLVSLQFPLIRGPAERDDAIWNPQANVFFERAPDAATIDGLSPQADTIEMKLPKVSGQARFRIRADFLSR
jgi:hypothetical protein